MGRIRTRAVAILPPVLACATLWVLAAQTVFRVDVRLVRLLVTVKDSAGALVGTLEKDDFRVTDSGVAQEIAVFEHHTEQPLSIALLVDTSASTGKDLKYEIEASTRFLEALTREGNPRDSLSFYSFNHDVTLQASFTRNPNRIAALLDKLRADAGTSMYDALWFASSHITDRAGRHVLIIVSDGGDTTSARTYQDALRAVHLADAVIYSLIVTPITNDAGRNTGGEHALIGLSRSTGGKAFFPTVGAALDQAFQDILRDLRTQYLIGYYPKNLPESKSKFRSLRLETKRPDLQVITRGGYYEE
jgi:Ca-activated chloride channel family protein